MNSARLLEFLSIDDYLKGEKVSPIKHEYVHGRVFAMAGASDSHNRIAGNIFAQLWQKANNCSIYMSDMKLQISNDIYYYPDIMVVCKEDKSDYFKTSPCLIVEVLSKSTAITDKREKLQAYLKLTSLQTYLLIDSETRAVTSYQKRGEDWLEQTHQADTDDILFPCLNTSLNLNNIYQNINLSLE